VRGELAFLGVDARRVLLQHPLALDERPCRGSGQAQLVELFNAARDDGYEEIIDRCEDVLHQAGKEYEESHVTYAELGGLRTDGLGVVREYLGGFWPDQLGRRKRLRGRPAHRHGKLEKQGV